MTCALILTDDASSVPIIAAIFFAVSSPPAAHADVFASPRTIASARA